MECTFNEYWRLVNQHKSQKYSPGIQATLAIMERNIAYNLVENTPDIWGEYNYIIVNITEHGLFPIKFKDLENAEKVSGHLQDIYYNDGTNPYYTGRIVFKVPHVDNSIIFG